MAFITHEMCSSLSVDTYVKLQNVKLLSIIEFICTDPEIVTERSGIVFKDILALRRIILGTKSSLPVAGDDLYDDVMASVAILSTGCLSLDSILDGGLYTSEVTEIFGTAGSGKTQVCLNTAISVAIETEQYVFYIDTGGSFDVGRVHDILETKSLNEQTVMDICSRIICSQAFDAFELLSQLEEFKNTAANSNCKLLIVDCIASVISPILGGQQTDGHSFMIHISRYLKNLASEFSLAVLITNNAVNSNDNSLKPSLGKSWLNIPNNRIELFKDHTPIGDKGELVLSNQRQARLVKSCRQAIGSSTIFQITNSGLEAAH